MPASQLNQGTPFYGYKYTNVSELFGLCPNSATTPDGECDNTVKTLSYGPQIKDKVNAHGWVSYRDPVAEEAAAVGDANSVFAHRTSPPPNFTVSLSLIDGPPLTPLR